MELNINDLNKNSLIMKWNVDANNNPAAVYITNEVQQVSTTHNIIQLAQVPDEYMKMRIVSETDELVEVFNRREIAPTTYYVDYGCGLVYFHESLAGQLVKADYYGRGIILLSDKRVFHTVGGDFAYTLDELISKSQDAVDLLESAGGLSGALDLIDEKVQAGNDVADRIEGFVDATEFYGYTIILSREAFVVKAKEDGNVDVTEINSVFSDVIVYKGGQQITPALSIDSSTNCVFSITGQRIILESLDVATVKGQAVVNIDCGDGLVAQRTIEVTKVFDGVNQYQVDLTNTFYSFNSTSDGNIETEQEAIVSVNVTKGNEDYLGYEVTVQNMPSGLVCEMASNINPNSITFRANTGSSLPDSGTVLIIFKLDSETTVTKTFSFNKAKHGLNARTLIMTGNQIFKYERGDYSDIPTPNYTTLTIQATGLSGTPVWFYKDVDNDVWVEITGQTSNTFVLSHNNPIWNDKHEITVKCELDGMSDELTIIKISNGVSGEDSYAMLLSNESSVIPVNENGEVSDNEIVKQYTKVSLYKGGTKVEPINITVQPSDDNWYEVGVTDDKVYLISITPDELSVVIPITVEFDGLSFTKTWTIAKAQKGNDGVDGLSGSSYVLNVIGGTRSITYNQINTDPRPSISGQFSAELYKDGNDISGEVTNWYWTTSGNLTGESLLDTFTPTISQTLDEALTVNSVQVTATHNGMPITYTVPIAITKDAAGLDWVADWDSTKVSIRDQEVLTPKIFAGTYDEPSDSVTGVAIGSDVLNDGQTIGVVGYQNNQVSFLLDTDGSLIIGDPYTTNSVGIGYDNGQLVISVSDLQIRGIKAATTQDIVTTVDQMSEDLRVDLQSGIDGANSSVNDLNIYLDEVVKDGLISEIEKAKLQGLYENVVQEVNGVEAQYKAVREHPLLTDTTVIATLEAAHDDYVVAYTEVFDAYTELITLAGTIQEIDVPDGEVDPVVPPGGTTDSDIIEEEVDPVDPVEDLEQGIGNDDPEIYTPVSSERFVRAIENYKVAAGNLYEEMNKANLSISEAKAQQIVNNAKQEIQVEIQDTQDALNELENTMNNEFKTGLIGNINLAILEERLNQLSVEKKDIDNQYDVLVNNTILDNTIKTDLIQVKGDLDIAHTALTTKINSVIADGLFTESEMEEVNNLIETYATELGDYSKVAQEANVDIAVKNAQQAVELMTQEQVFNKLTDNGNVQGLFMDNGQLYVNGEYINTRNFKAVTDDGEQTFLIDENGNVHISAENFTLGGSSVTTQQDVINIFNNMNRSQNLLTQPTFNSGMGTWKVSVSSYIKKDTTHVREVDGVTSEAVKLSYSGTSNGLALWTYDWTIDKLTANTKYTAQAYVYFEDTSTLTGNMTLGVYGTADGTSTPLGVKEFTASDFENGKWNEISMEFTTTRDYDNQCYQIKCSKGCTAWVTDCAVYGDKSLTQEELVKILNGAGDGFYLIDDKLYINANYIQTGTLAADLIQVRVDGATNLLPFNYITMDNAMNINAFSVQTHGEVPHMETDIPIYRGGGSTDILCTPIGYSHVKLRKGMSYWFSCEVMAQWDNDTKLEDGIGTSTVGGGNKTGVGTQTGNNLDLFLYNRTDNTKINTGRNLLDNTSCANTYKYITMFSVSEPSISGFSAVVTAGDAYDYGNLMLTCSDTSVENYYRFMAPSPGQMYGMEAGCTYTLSGLICGTMSSITIRHQYHANGGSWTNSNLENKDIPITSVDEWQPFSFTFTIPPYADGYYLSFQNYGNPQNSICYLAHLKLEKSPTATPWCLSPADQGITLDNPYNIESSYVAPMLASMRDFNASIDMEERYTDSYIRTWTRLVGRIDATYDYEGSLWINLDGSGFGVGNYAYFYIQNLQLVDASENDETIQLDYVKQLKEKRIELTDGSYFTNLVGVDGIKLTEGVISGETKVGNRYFKINYDGYKFASSTGSEHSFMGLGKSYYRYWAGSTGIIDGYDNLYGVGCMKIVGGDDQGIFIGVHEGFQIPNGQEYGRADIYRRSSYSDSTAMDDWTDWELLGQKVEPLALVRRDEKCAITASGMVLTGDGSDGKFPDGDTWHGSVIFSEPMHSKTGNGQIVNTNKDSNMIYLGNPRTPLKLETYQYIEVVTGADNGTQRIITNGTQLGHPQVNIYTGSNIEIWADCDYTSTTEKVWIGAGGNAITITSSGTGQSNTNVRYNNKIMYHEGYQQTSTSDVRYKRAVSDVNTSDCYDMVKNTQLHHYLLLDDTDELHACSETGIEELNTELDSNNYSRKVQMGIIAQDVLKYECGKYFVVQDINKDDDGNITSDKYSIDAYNYASAILGGLQEEIKVRDAQYEELKNEIQELKQIINELKGE